MFEWLNQNYLALIFIVTTLLAIVKAILSALGKKKAADAVEELKKILHQTFGNVEALKTKWAESGAEAKFGHIGQIFAEINKEKGLDTVLKTAYDQYLEEKKKKEEKKPEELNK